LALAIGLFSLRVKAIFFAMVTLAVASAFAVLVSQLSWLTGGEDGLNYSIPRELTPAFKLVDEKMDVRINGKLLLYYLVFFASLILFLDYAADREFALRPDAEGRSRQCFPGRGHRLSGRLVPHRRDRAVGGYRRPGRRRCSRSGCATPARRRRCRWKS
jgi:hypothetical protein